MLPYVSKLLIARQLKFEKGQMSIFGERVLIFPIDMVKIIIEKSIKDKAFATSIYDAAKQSVRSFCQNVNSRLGIKKPKDMLDILLNLTEMNGYGQIEPIKVDYENKFATFHLHGLPSQALFGKVKNVKTVDVYWCGLVAGGMTFVFNTDVDCVETRCVVTGKESCEVVAAKKDRLIRHLKENKLLTPLYLK